jgi:GAF domain-containing protein
VATDDPIEASITALSQFFVGGGSLGETLTRVTELARDALEADMAGITMLLAGRPRTGVFTDPATVEIDTAQYETEGRGPCLDAFRQQRVHHIADTATDRRWPEFAAVAAAHGVVTTLSLPLAGGGEPVGALNFYSRRPGAFDRPTEQAEVLAAQAAIVLVNAHAYHDSRELADNLQQALTSRQTIDYAIGLIMSGGGRSPEEAFQLLVRASQRENRKLRDIAADMVAAAQARRTPAPPPRPWPPATARWARCDHETVRCRRKQTVLVEHNSRRHVPEPNRVFDGRCHGDRKLGAGDHDRRV